LEAEGKKRQEWENIKRKKIEESRKHPSQVILCSCYKENSSKYTDIELYPR
jgi:hypothetical protein